MDPVSPMEVGPAVHRSEVAHTSQVVQQMPSVQPSRRKGENVLPSHAALDHDAHSPPSSACRGCAFAVRLGFPGSRLADPLRGSVPRRGRPSAAAGRGVRPGPHADRAGRDARHRPRQGRRDQRGRRDAHHSAERTEKEETTKKHFHRKEIHYGGFSRTLPLPEGVDEADISAPTRTGSSRSTSRRPRRPRPKPSESLSPALDGLAAAGYSRISRRGPTRPSPRCRN